MASFPPGAADPDEIVASRLLSLINWINSTMIPRSAGGKVSVERTMEEGMKAHLVIRTTPPFLVRNNTTIAQTICFLQSGFFSSLKK